MKDWWSIQTKPWKLATLVNRCFAFLKYASLLSSFCTRYWSSEKNVFDFLKNIILEIRRLNNTLNRCKLYRIETKVIFLWNVNPLYFKKTKDEFMLTSADVSDCDEMTDAVLGAEEKACISHSVLNGTCKKLKRSDKSRKLEFFTLAQICIFQGLFESLD